MVLGNWWGDMGECAFVYVRNVVWSALEKRECQSVWLFWMFDVRDRNVASMHMDSFSGMHGLQCS